MAGIATSSSSLATAPGATTSYIYRSGYKQNVTSGLIAYGSGLSNGSIVGVAFDADAGTLAFYKNGISQGVAFSGLTSGPYFPTFGNTGLSASLNFGQ